LHGLAAIGSGIGLGGIGNGACDRAAPEATDKIQLAMIIIAAPGQRSPSRSSMFLLGQIASLGLRQ
jgi:hypothetical protein